MSLEAGTRIGPYEITGTLGAGGMGEVYRARDPKLNRDVALDADPLEDISGASRVAGVLVRGRWVGRDEIEKTMRELAGSSQAPSGLPPRRQ